MTPRLDRTLHPRHSYELAHGRSGAAALAIALAAPLALAEDMPVDERAKSGYVIGLAVKSAPEYEGSDRYALKLRPLWAYRYGRFKISTSGASAIMGFAADPVGSGVSAELLRTDRWKLAAALRFDSGRQSGDSARLAGLPDIQRTLRGRFSVSYRLDDEWGVGASVSQDLLGRGGGAEVGLNLGYRHWLSATTAVSAGAGLSFGDSRYMQTYYGITDAQSSASGLAAYAPQAGLKNLGVGVGIMTALTPRWIAFANAGSSRLLGDAASSPLTYRATSASVYFGLAYRCCK